MLIFQKFPRFYVHTLIVCGFFCGGSSSGISICPAGRRTYANDAVGARILTGPAEKSRTQAQSFRHKRGRLHDRSAINSSHAQKVTVAAIQVADPTLRPKSLQTGKIRAIPSFEGSRFKMK